MKIISRSQLQEDLKKEQFESIFPDMVEKLREYRVKPSCGCRGKLIDFVMKNTDKLQAYYGEKVFVSAGDRNNTYTFSIKAGINALDETIDDFKKDHPANGFFKDYKLTNVGNDEVLVTFIYDHYTKALRRNTVRNVPRLFITTNCVECTSLREVLSFSPDTDEIDNLRVILLNGSESSNLDVVAHYGIIDIEKIEFPCIVEDGKLINGLNACHEYLFALGLATA